MAERQNLTASEAIKELRAAAKKVGATFKRVNVTYNGKPAYAVFSRENGLKLSGDNILWNWYEQFCANDFDEYDQSGAYLNQ